MRIAFVVGTFPALSQTFIESQIDGLVRRGHAIDVFATRRPDSPTAGPSVPCHYWPGRLGDRIAHARSAAALAGRDVRRLLGRSLFASGRGTGWGPVSLFLAAVAMKRAGPFDAIVCHFGPNGLAAERVRSIGGVDAPIATFFHGYDLSRWLRTRPPRVYSPLFRSGEWILPISEHWKRRLVEIGCPAEKLRVHRMGIDCRAIAFAPRTIGEGPIRILSVGRLVEKKGFDLGVRAFAQIASRHPRARLDVVGDGPERSRIERVVRELGIADRVVLHGAKTPAELAPIRDAAHVALVPSRTAKDGDQEGIPVVALEALASGLPVVGTRHTGIPEVVRDGETGLVADEGDVEGLAAKLGELLDHPEWIARFGAAGRRLVEAEFDVDVLNDRLAALLAEAATSYRARA